MPRIVIPEDLFYFKNQFVFVKKDKLEQDKPIFSDIHNDYVLNINYSPSRKRAAIYMDEETFVPLDIKGNIEININNVRDTMVTLACWDAVQQFTPTFLKKLTINTDNYLCLSFGNEFGDGHYTFEELHLNIQYLNLYVEKITELEKIIITKVKSLDPNQLTKIVLKDLPRLKEIDLSTIESFNFHYIQDNQALKFLNLPPKCKIIFNENASFNIPVNFHSTAEIYKQLFKETDRTELEELEEEDNEFPMKILLKRFFKTENNLIVTTVKQFQETCLEMFKNSDINTNMWKNILNE